MRAAALALRRRATAATVVAVPVAAPEVDDTVCARTLEPFFGVGRWCGDFSQTADEDVHEPVSRAASRPAASRGCATAEGDRPATPHP